MNRQQQIADVLRALGINVLTATAAAALLDTRSVSQSRIRHAALFGAAMASVGILLDAAQGGDNPPPPILLPRGAGQLPTIIGGGS